MRKKAVSAPPEIDTAKDVEPVDPEEVNEILADADRTAAAPKPDDNNVTSPMTKMSSRERRNGHA